MSIGSAAGARSTRSLRALPVRAVVVPCEAGAVRDRLEACGAAAALSRSFAAGAGAAGAGAVGARV
ncbi:MAG: hypothetical protein DMF77_25690 [Acidobacteria bacterium]|nr:MAG: hypothetical protein DMF77_25690 [Acidobacteriota bacterium]